MCVCGRRRVPFPASGMITFMRGSSWAPSWRAGSLPPVAVLDPHDVVELGGGRLEHVAVGDGLHVVNRARRDAEGVAHPETLVLQLAVRVELDPVLHLAAEQVDRLV